MGPLVIICVQNCKAKQYVEKISIRKKISFGIKVTYLIYAYEGPRLWKLDLVHFKDENCFMPQKLLGQLLVISFTNLDGHMH